MRYRRFFVYNVVGGVAWVAICLFSGFFFGGISWVKNNFDIVILAIVVISVLPMAVEFCQAWYRKPGHYSENQADKPLAA
jgi:membrane-associated protein